MKYDNLEIGRQKIQETLDASKGLEDRNRLGQYATPPQLAFQMAKVASDFWSKKNKSVKFLDPGFGSGVFYSALRAMFSDHNIESAIGIEFDKEVFSLSKDLWENTSLQLENADFVTKNPTEKEKVNLVICNPPYVRHHHLRPNQKRQMQLNVKEKTGLVLNSLAGLYCYFLLLSDQWLEENGLGVWLVPSEFMDVNYGDVLREYFTKNVTLLRVHRFESEDVQFADALVSSSVVVFKKKRPSDETDVIFSTGGSLLQPKTSVKLLNSFLKKNNKWTKISEYSERSTKRMSNLSLADLFIIRRGLATGSNSFFIITRQRATELQLPTKFLKPILPSPRYLKHDIVEVSPDGFPEIHPQLVLVSCHLPENEIKEKYPELWKYLLLGKELGVDQGYLANARSPWYRQEELKPAPFLVTYMGRQTSSLAPFRFVMNKSQALAANSYHLLYPRPFLQASVDEGIFTIEDIYNLLQQVEIGELVHEGRTYGGGLHKIEPGELKGVRFSENARMRNYAVTEDLFNWTSLRQNL